MNIQEVFPFSINKIHLFDGNKQSIISKASDDVGHVEQTMSL